MSVVHVQCTKYVLKPGPGAGKAAYEIEHVAYTCVPRVTVSDWQTLTVGQPTRITLVIRNTVEREISVRLTAVTSGVRQQPTSRTSSTQQSPVSTADVWSVLPSAASCDAQISDEWVWLPAYDEIAEESGILQEQKRPDDAPADNPKVTHQLILTMQRWRRTLLYACQFCSLRLCVCCPLQYVLQRSLSKVGLSLSVTPLSSDVLVQVSHTETNSTQLSSFLAQMDNPLTVSPIYVHLFVAVCLPVRCDDGSDKHVIHNFNLCTVAVVCTLRTGISKHTAFQQLNRHIPFTSKLSVTCTIVECSATKKRLRS